MLPLSGITVVDLTRLLPGAYCTLTLADLGAEVIKVEDPGHGDPVRALPPYSGGTSVYFQALHRNKRSITLNLRTPAGRELLAALADHADVLVESFRPQTARRLHVSSADFHARQPRLIHCSITGFGGTGPRAAQAGHDINFLALAGLLSVDPPSTTEPPNLPRVFLADIGSALNAAAGIAAALFARERTGEGAAIEVSLHETALSWLTFPAASAMVAPGPVETQLPISGREACYTVYRTADGQHVALGALEAKYWARFCEGIGRPDLIPFQYARSAAQARTRDEVSRILVTRPRDEWVAMFADLDACLTPVNTVCEGLADPHLAARGAVLQDRGRRVVRTPIRISSSSGRADHPEAHMLRVQGARPLGADTDAVLDAIGIGADERRRLRAGGAI